MPYRDRATQRAYQRRWMAERRRAYLEGKACATCGATDPTQLELNHIIPLCRNPRPMRHRIFSYTAVKREAELALVEPLCRACHHAESLRTGVLYSSAKLTPTDVREIRAGGQSVPAAVLAKRYGVRPEAIRKVLANETWKILPDPEFEHTRLQKAA